MSVSKRKGRDVTPTFQKLISVNNFFNKHNHYQILNKNAYSNNFLPL